MPTCSLCHTTINMDKPICMGCWLRAREESHNALFGQGKFDTIDYELVKIKEELKEIKTLLNNFVPKKLKLKLREEVF
jgi:hypothetical protein